MSPGDRGPSTPGVFLPALDGAPLGRHVGPVILLLTACAVHLGVAPAVHRWSLSEVRAPVAEPGVGDAVRRALLADLAARGALDPAGPGLDVEVRTADWTPSRRAGAVLLYDARLVVRVGAGEGSREAWAQRSVPDPGVAAAVPELRARVFGELADQVAQELAAWVSVQ